VESVNTAVLRIGVMRTVGTALATRGAALGVWLVAGWPVWRWYVARIGDGSDEPWGLASLAVALAFVPWRRLREPLAAGSVLAVASVAAAVLLGHLWLPALVRGGLWMLGLAVLFGDAGPALARAGLLILSLPVVATAQFYLGYPLRAFTALCSVPPLRLLGYEVSRQGTALRWAGETVLVDAPCSGIQMLWTGLFAACALAAVRGLGWRATLTLLRWTGCVVAAANWMRCVVLFLVEVRGVVPPQWLHVAIGLAAFGAALGTVVWKAGRLGQDALLPVRKATEKRRDGGGRPAAGWMLLALGGVLLGATVRPLFGAGDEESRATATFPGWPVEYEGRTLARLRASEREMRFAAGFPGMVAAFTDGERTILLRWVAHETRKLHPAQHCLRGLGYAVEPGPVWRDAQGRNWGTTVAERDGLRRRIRERICDAAGGEWTDVSAWWWDAWLGRSTGPWWAATVFQD